MPTVSDYIVEELSKLGIKDVFMLPGGGAMHLNDSIARSKHVNPIICQHEQACGISAEAYGRIDRPHTAKFGVCLVTSGPGSTNAITAVAGAWIDSIPLLVISGQAKVSDLNYTGKIRQKGVQEVDITSMVKNVTKFCVRLTNAEYTHEVFQKCINDMLSGRPGPVWLEIPLDIQARDIQCLKEVVLPKKKILPVDLSGILNEIESSERPLILAGHGVRLSGASDKFRSWVERHNLPVVTTWNALDLLSFDNKLNIGRPGVVANRAANITIQNADLIIVIGARLDNVITAYNLGDFGRNAKLFVVDIDQNELDDKAHVERLHGINADAFDFIEAVFDLNFCKKTERWLASCIELKFLFEVERDVDTVHEKISHRQFVKKASKIVPEEANIATGSSGLAIEFLYAGFQNKAKQRMFLTSGLGSMGYGLAQAIGVSVADPSKPVYLFESDGSLMLNLQELATIKSYDLSIILFIMNNGGYASIKNTQTNYFEKRFLGVDEKSGLWLPDFKTVAAAFDIPYFKIEKLSELNTELLKNRQVMIDVILNDTDLLEPKCQAIVSKDGTIRSMPLEDLSPLLDIDELSAFLNGKVSPSSILARNDE